ncbi:serine hydrolase domain-containing protein [Aliikangiella coralliicola]|uniref:Beta-lactamase family protein n=1 Tax=Aliikangiella coralliicola TaxID=2592383 RepID=A0A545UDW9_9GAMM|nr:serine hydrolase domain-containing protein [Aliikangiella coralliicola]TQV87623.1 beta-lactamase family protein [Aliikangiella coralliicola]
MHNLPVLLLIVFVFTGCGGSGSETTAPPPDTSINMNKVLDDFIANNSHIASISMLVVKNGNVIFSHGAGFFDAEKSKVPTEETLYKTSSIAKLIISVAVMQLVESDQLNIDQDISQYLDFQVRHRDFPEKVITTKMLMQHAASLANPAPGEVVDDLFLSFDPTDILQLHPLIEDVLTPGNAAYKETIWLTEEPGTLYKNSNFGMVLLSYLVEKLSGQHFIDYCQQNIFGPLNMNNTSHYFPALALNHVATLYDGNNSITAPSSNWFYPISGLYTSTGDWANFMRAILNGGSLNGSQILQSDSVNQLLNMTTPTNNQLAYNSSIGLIWRQAQANPGWVGHTGAGTQVTHVTELNPENNIGYVVFTNEGRIDALIGPGGSLNVVIHQWLQQQID